MQEAIRDKRIFRNFARDNDKRQTSQGVCPPVSLEIKDELVYLPLYMTPLL